MKPTKAMLRGLAVAMIIVSSGLGACASGARPEQMVASTPIAPTQPGEPGYKQFRVAGAQGGSKTNPLWMSNVSNEEFAAALESSLKATNYLADDPTQATTEVSANMVDLKRPMAGLDLSVTSQVRYSATKVNDGALIYDDTVAATGTGKMGDALIAVERLRIANEKSIQANIEAFILRLRETLRGS